MKVKEKLEVFWKENNLGKDGKIDASWNLFKIGRLGFYFPNLSKKGYLLHDVNHLLSGYGIDWLSEFEIAAWELGSGSRKVFYLSNFYPIVGFLLDLIFIPSRTIRALKDGKSRANAHILSHTVNDIMDMEFDELVRSSHQKR
ncbi:hypothetical protein [Reichenbachiella versicolor]|uniref:hypothetical protein n=1 Tax=Reichenbachiella versicolor TaxID=1821036 RepID=UPI000D6DDE70|nr:hypothetical protein [Reichenbachiella versicolor]